MAIVEADGVNRKTVYRNLGGVDGSWRPRVEIFNNYIGIIDFEYGVGRKGARKYTASVKHQFRDVVIAVQTAGIQVE
ncbi:MAG TPA: hypothetical protein PKA19_08000 [Bacillota bacterium]|nr:hypothetical protein [Bacillota bacterium]